MGTLPRQLKDMMVFGNGEAWVGDASSVTLPVLGRIMEEYRGAGMTRAVKIDMGGTPLEAEFTFGGPMREVVRAYGSAQINSEQLRFVGIYENDDTGELTNVEVVMRGRYEEIDRGEQKPGEASEFKAKAALGYYKETWNGVTEIEIDVLGMVEIAGGVDRLAERRALLGL